MDKIYCYFIPTIRNTETIYIGSLGSYLRHPLYLSIRLYLDFDHNHTYKQCHENVYMSLACLSEEGFAYQS